jgi:hypothetical protein
MEPAKEELHRELNVSRNSQNKKMQEFNSLNLTNTSRELYNETIPDISQTNTDHQLTERETNSNHFFKNTNRSRLSGGLSNGKPLTTQHASRAAEELVKSTLFPNAVISPRAQDMEYTDRDLEDLE